MRLQRHSPRIGRQLHLQISVVALYVILVALDVVVADNVIEEHSGLQHRGRLSGLRHQVVVAFVLHVDEHHDLAALAPALEVLLRQPHHLPLLPRRHALAVRQTCARRLAFLPTRYHRYREVMHTPSICTSFDGDRSIVADLRRNGELEHTSFFLVEEHLELDAVLEFELAAEECLELELALSLRTCNADVEVAVKCDVLVVDGARVLAVCRTLPV